MWQREGGQDYLPIRDYALIGDTRTAALVGKNGSIDWLCCPRFDSDAVFCRLLDRERGGFFRIAPLQSADVSRQYLGDSNVLITTFTSPEGSFRLLDFMPLHQMEAAQEGNQHEIIRLVEGVSGEIDVVVGFRPSFGFARSHTALEPVADGAVAWTDTESMTLACPVELKRGETLTGSAHVKAGDRLWFSLLYQPTPEPKPPVYRPGDGEKALRDTTEYWQQWSARCTYEGPYHSLVRRSALVLKLLTFGLTGAIVAAPTTSLPEEVGGVRNWDYRFTWLRDSGLILDALQSIGYHTEAEAFFNWLSSLCLLAERPLQIMYTIDGSPELPEQTVESLEGYRRSAPVRVGNAAAAQSQMDIFGEVLEAAWLHVEWMKAKPNRRLASVLARLADEAAARWQEPDHGIWETRGGPRHFLYSKLLCWVALDRALALARHGVIEGDTMHWEEVAEQIREVILAEGYASELQCFTQELGKTALDASALVIPLVGFLPATDPRVLSTMDAIRSRLSNSGLLYRYRDDDGLPGREATFAICSFWLVDNLALGNRLDEARQLFEHVTSYANDVGLLAEQIEPVSGELLGNFPQGFTHLALVRSALRIAQAERRVASAGLSGL